MNQKNKTEITDVPGKRILPLENLYLDQNLLIESERLGRSIVYTNYICDLSDVIATKDQDGVFRVPKALRNPDDWRLFQELEAQAEVIITSRAYLNRVAVPGESAQDILAQFEAGVEFSELGAWRLKNGFAARSPDIAIVGRGADIVIPKSLFKVRNIIYFTTYDVAGSDEGKRLEDLGVAVVGAGLHAVAGKAMIGYLTARRRYRTICMVSGPNVLSLLLDGNLLDRLYLTRVHRKLSAGPSSLIRIGYRGKRISEMDGFTLTRQYRQENVTTDDGMITSQEFLVYEKLRR